MYTQGETLLGNPQMKALSGPSSVISIIFLLQNNLISQTFHNASEGLLLHNTLVSGYM